MFPEIETGLSKDDAMRGIMFGPCESRNKMPGRCQINFVSFEVFPKTDTENRIPIHGKQHVCEMKSDR